jgi:hypothetical protein
MAQGQKQARASRPQQPLRTLKRTVQGSVGWGRRDQRKGEGLLIRDRQPKLFSLPDGLGCGALQRIDHEVGDRTPLDLGRPLDRTVKISVDPGFQSLCRAGSTSGPYRRARSGLGIHGGILVD